jgi:hypothetical protein
VDVEQSEPLGIAAGVDPESIAGVDRDLPGGGQIDLVDPLALKLRLAAPAGAAPSSSKAAIINRRIGILHCVMRAIHHYYRCSQARRLIERRA